MSAETTFLAALDRSGVLTVHARGELDLGCEEQLVNAVRDPLSSGSASEVVLDLTAVEFIDSSGLRAVLRCQEVAQEAYVPFKLCVKDGPVRRLFAITGVGHKFDYV